MSGRSRARTRESSFASAAASVLVSCALIATGCGGGGSAGGSADDVQRLLGAIARGDDATADLAQAADQYGPAFADRLRRPARAVENVRVLVNDPFARDAACGTVDAVDAAGGPEGLTLQELVTTAQQQFGTTQRQQAENLAGALDDMTNLEFLSGPKLACAARDAGSG